MEKYEINKYIEKFSQNILDLENALHPEQLRASIKEINEKMLDVNFWSDQGSSSKIIGELNILKENLLIYDEAFGQYNDILEMIELHQLEPTDESLELLESMILDFSRSIDEKMIKVILSEEYDHYDAILEIHPGAGGVESMDWASMLLRMYQRYSLSKNFKFQIIDYIAGEEAGVKSVTVQITGKNVYGMLKSERGVHRLVRISPFDSNSRRHTSFASVDISPLIEDIVGIKINDEDLKIDVYHSSGAGGQSVNTTDSAVRITHKPTNIVVCCQNERSQLKNKEQALKILNSKLLELEIQKQEEEIQSLKGTISQNAFGSQIRSYIFCPYTLVKDHRTDTEVGNVNSVMDGDLDVFIYSYLKNSAGD